METRGLLLWYNNSEDARGREKALGTRLQSVVTYVQCMMGVLSIQRLLVLWLAVFSLAWYKTRCKHVKCCLSVTGVSGLVIWFLRRSHSIQRLFLCSRDQTPSCSAVRGCRLSEILTTLLDLAARYLVLHGRLVYWLPIYRPRWLLLRCLKCFRI